MTMLRKIRRSVAKFYIHNEETSLFKKYAPSVKKTWDKRKKKMVEKPCQRSYFARVWRSYL